MRTLSLLNLEVARWVKSPKRGWTCDLIAFLFAVLTFAIFLFIANFGFGVVKIEP